MGGFAKLQWAMPELSRRRYPERQDCRHVYFGDVRVGTIARRTGQPHDEDPWEWITVAQRQDGICR
jgi:hypothetical protein